MTPVFDSSVTANANAAAIEKAISTAASALGSAFTNPATVRFNVSWGSVMGEAIPSGDVSSSVENLTGPFSYTTITADLKALAAANPSDAVLNSAVAHLPRANPAGALSYEVPYSEAQAIGLLPPSMKLAAGGIGFSSAIAWDFNPLDGVAANTYDLEGAAIHEISEVLGRITGLDSARPTLATPFDLFRYSTVGVSSFSYTAPAYFSVDGGRTLVERFNVTGGGDRSDIASSSGLTDAQAAYLPRATALTLSAADLTVLDALGWGGFVAPTIGGMSDPLYLGSLQSFGGSIPEPAAWSLLLIGFGLVGGSARAFQRRVSTAALG